MPDRSHLTLNITLTAAAWAKLKMTVDVKYEFEFPDPTLIQRCHMIGHKIRLYLRLVYIE